MNNFTRLNLVSGIYVNYKNIDIDLSLAQTFKFLNLNSNDLILFLKNEKKSWRYLNKYVQNFYLYKYTANSLKTANSEIDFDNSGMNEFIKNTSPLYSIYNYDISGANLNGVVYPSLDPMIFEIRFLDNDINGRVVSY